MDGWKMKFPFAKPNFQVQTVGFREDNSTLMDDRDACQVMTLRPDPSFLEYMSAVAVWWPQVDTKKGTCETWWKLVILNSCKKTPKNRGLQCWNITESDPKSFLRTWRDHTTCGQLAKHVFELFWKPKGRMHLKKKQFFFCAWSTPVDQKFNRVPTKWAPTSCK